MLIVPGTLVVVLVAAAGLALRGRGLRMTVIHCVRALIAHRNIEQSGDFNNVIFVHQSTGRNLIREGDVREHLASAGFQFWDHDYNWEGLTRPDGERAGYSYRIPDNNTNPDGYAGIFSQRFYSWPLNAFSGLMQHDVIAFKSCFPVSDIKSNEHLEQHKAYYLSMRDVMDQHRDRIFIVVTPPPLNPGATDAEAASRARAFVDWLGSDEFLGGHPNVFTFDFFDLLAEGDPTALDFNTLRAKYREGNDSHPNLLANQVVGRLFADFVIEAVHTYRTELAREGNEP
jgi:hypothetical protein